MKEWLLSKVAGWIGGKLNGYKTKIGAVCLFLYGAVSLAGKIFPDQNLPGADMDFSQILKMFSGALDGLGVFGAAMTAAGVTHKAIKQESATPIPVVTTHQPVEDSTGPIQETTSGVIQQEMAPGPPVGSSGFSPGEN